MERTFLIGIKRPKSGFLEMEASLGELARLVDTAGGVVVGSDWQDVRRIVPSTFIGEGKIESVKQAVKELGATLVAFDDELSPAQNKNLSDQLEVKVLDRTAVILDIFASRARTREGELQVELAQLNYRMSRLTGRGLSLMQQAGYIGNRGPGETKLEIDRRRIRDRISVLRRWIKDVRKHRELHRRHREKVPVPVVSLVGYTNSGKSTLLNSFTGAGVLAEDKLFATLDPTVRRLKLPNGREILLADTVGFIRKLPHQLVEAFKATFEEVERSDLLLHLIDASEPDFETQSDVVYKVLDELEMARKPIIRVYNKCDADKIFVKDFRDGVAISALKGIGLTNLMEKIDESLSSDFKHSHLRLPHTEGAVLSELYRIGRVIEVKHLKGGIMVEADLPEKLAGRYKKFSI